MLVNFECRNVRYLCFTVIGFVSHALIYHIAWWTVTSPFSLPISPCSSPVPLLATSSNYPHGSDENDAHFQHNFLDLLGWANRCKHVQETFAPLPFSYPSTPPPSCPCAFACVFLSIDITRYFDIYWDNNGFIMRQEEGWKEKVWFLSSLSPSRSQHQLTA